MKASLVKGIVDAVADSAHARRSPLNDEHCCTACATRLLALEALVDALVDAALTGTSADPDKPGKK